MGKRTRPRPAPAAAAQARAGAVFKRAGSLHGRVLKPGTVKRYTAHVKEFFRWCRRTGRTIPSSTVAFDTLLCAYAEELWQENDSKSVLANTLSGLVYFTISLKQKLPGAWRLYKAWAKHEPGRRAPPLTVLMMQAVAGYFAYQGEKRAAVMICTAHHCILRTGEMLSLRSTDVTFAGTLCQLRLRDTKIGQRLDITEETNILDPWLFRTFKKVIKFVYPGDVLVGMTPRAFRQMWASAVKAVGLPQAYKPYGLRRGGATAFFQHCGSFGRTANRGRWGTEQAMRQYVTTALAELAEHQHQESDNSTLCGWASHLHAI